MVLRLHLYGGNIISSHIIFKRPSDRVRRGHVMRVFFVVRWFHSLAMRTSMVGISWLFLLIATKMFAWIFLVRIGWR